MQLHHAKVSQYTNWKHNKDSENETELFLTCAVLIRLDVFLLFSV